MPELFKKKPKIILGAILFAALGSMLFAQIKKVDTRAQQKAMFDNYVEYGFVTLEEMVTAFQNTQKDLIRILPPGMENLNQRAGKKYFTPNRFQKEFVAGLVARTYDGYVTYPVTVLEHPESKEYIFLNDRGEEFYSIAPPLGYDDEWLLLSYHPNFYTKVRTYEEIDLLREMFSPSRVLVSWELIERKDLEVFISQLPMFNKVISKPPVFIKKAYTGPAVTTLKFTCIENTSSGIVVTLAYPSNIYTNDIDIFSTPSQLNNPFWDLADTISVSATNWVEWVDSEGTNSTFTKRFYRAGNGDLNATTDPDDDDLTWAREIYMYHTSPTNSDTDGDSIDDGIEVDNRTDPNNSDTNKPTASFLFPTNNYKWVWIP